MKLRVRSELTYRFEAPTDAIYLVQAALWPGQTLLEEHLEGPPGVELISHTTPDYGSRTLRARLTGDVRLMYEAVIDNGTLKRLPPTAYQHGWTELPGQTLTYLWPSRYCPSDGFERFVEGQWSEVHGGARVLAILDWIKTNIAYVHGVSTPQTTAADTFLDRAGVCRDFTHLGMAMCRASGIPARAVSAYALDLDPPDFHAVFEVYLSGGWWLVDPTGLAPIEGLVRIASGRDAVDIAFLSSNGPCRMLNQSVSVKRA